CNAKTSPPEPCRLADRRPASRRQRHSSLARLRERRFCIRRAPRDAVSVDETTHDIEKIGTLSSQKDNVCHGADRAQLLHEPASTRAGGAHTARELHHWQGQCGTSKDSGLCPE
uniref:Integron gene cassette protein n=1 Tax=Macrostomum lignano TaxID=282301 RepID=A0A1I8F364_9PLAT